MSDRDVVDNFLFRLGVALAAAEGGVPDPLVEEERLARGDALLAADVGLRIVRSDEQRLVDGQAAYDQHRMQVDLKW